VMRGFLAKTLDRLSVSVRNFSFFRQRQHLLPPVPVEGAPFYAFRTIESQKVLKRTHIRPPEDLRSPRSAERYYHERDSCSFYHLLHRRSRAIARPIACANSNARGCPGISAWNIDRPKWRRLGYEPGRHRISR
jgi:hypothetical protein